MAGNEKRAGSADTHTPQHLSCVQASQDKKSQDTGANLFVGNLDESVRPQATRLDAPAAALPGLSGCRAAGKTKHALRTL